MVTRILCVAEKPSIAKAVALHLGGGQVQTVSDTAISSQCQKLTTAADTDHWQCIHKELRIPVHFPCMGSLQCHHDLRGWSFD